MFNRIESSRTVLGGKPCIKGTRISIAFILELTASGADRDDIVHAYPQLTGQDVEEALQYATHFLENDFDLSNDVGP
jgi:uncharacterized protein (DUF433 family)